MSSIQTLSLANRRAVAAWAADCAERVLPLFELERPTSDVPRDAIARTRSFSRGELDAAGEIRRRLIAGRATHEVRGAAAVAAALAAAQAAAVAHMGAHALGAAGYAAKAADLAASGQPDALRDEVRWQLDRMSAEVREALGLLPLLEDDTAGPLGPGLLSRGVVGAAIRRIQADLHG